jgi:hypothetical protein
MLCRLGIKGYPERIRGKGFTFRSSSLSLWRRIFDLQWPTLGTVILEMKDPAMGESRSLLAGSRVYLSGPMDFVSSRSEERLRGWRAQISSYLSQLGCVVFDPWNKPNVRSIQGYGIED